MILLGPWCKREGIFHQEKSQCVQVDVGLVTFAFKAEGHGGTQVTCFLVQSYNSSGVQFGPAC